MASYDAYFWEKLSMDTIKKTHISEVYLDTTYFLWSAYYHIIADGINTFSLNPISVLNFLMMETENCDSLA